MAYEYESMNGKKIIQLGVLFGTLAVGIGAFGAHGLEDILIRQGRVSTFETGVHYHFYHSLALLLIGVLAYCKPELRRLQAPAICFILGILIFSGSLYTLSLTGITWLGAITPLGGVLFIVGWLTILWSFPSKSTS